AHVPDRLFDLRHVAKFQERAPLGLLAVHPSGHVVVDQAVAVESDLVANTRITLGEPHQSLHGPAAARLSTAIPRHSTCAYLERQGIISAARRPRPRAPQR